MKLDERRGLFIVASLILISFSLILISLAFTATPQASIGERRQYYLGDLIYSTKGHKFYFHGYENNYLIIGHETTRAMSNLYIETHFWGGNFQFQLLNQKFNVTQWFTSKNEWIELEKI